MTSSISTEKYLNLPEGRILAYSESGNTASTTVVLFFHGALGVGDASEPSTVLVEKDVHFIAPTLLGWGKSSPRNPSTPYHIQLASDISALVNHLHPNTDIKLYISGGSFGTVAAQMLYGAPFEIFPSGRYVKGCLLLAPCTPFAWDKSYTKSMTMSNYFAIGPLSQFIPFRLVQRLIVSVIRRKLSTVDKAETFIRGMLFDTMSTEERGRYMKWKERRGIPEGHTERRMAQHVVRSFEETWDGFLEIPDVMHSDWGFQPDCLDEEHNRRPILICTSEGDTMAPEAWAKMLASAYRNGRLKTTAGGHLASMYHMDDLWKELLHLN